MYLVRKGLWVLVLLAGPLTGCGCQGGGGPGGEPNGEEPNGEEPNGNQIEDDRKIKGFTQWGGFYAYTGPTEPCIVPDELPERSGSVEHVWDQVLTGWLGREWQMVLFGDSLFVLPWNGILYQIDRHTGRVPWWTRHFTDTGRGMVAGADGLLHVFGSQYQAVDPLELRVERRLMARGSEAFFNEPVVFEDGRVLIMGFWGDIRLEEPADTEYGYQTVWRYHVSNGRALTDPSVDEERGLAFVPVFPLEDDEKLLAMRLEDGHVAWRSTRSSHFKPRLIQQDRLHLIWTDMEAMTRISTLLDPATGEVRDEIVLRTAREFGTVYEVGGHTHVVFSPEADRYYVVQHRRREPRVGMVFAEIKAFDRDHRELWARWIPAPPHLDEDAREPSVDGFPPGSRIHHSPLVGRDGTLYMASQNCYVYALSSDGDLIWWDRMPYQAMTSGMKLSDDGMLYATSSLRGPDWYKTYVRAYRLVHLNSEEIEAPECPVEVPCPVVPPPEEE